MPSPRRSWVLPLVVSLGPALVVACGGGAREPRVATPDAPADAIASGANAGGSDAPPVTAGGPPAPAQSAPWSPSPKPEPSKAARWAWSAIGCWIGGAWSESLGALGDERPLATTKRCRTVAVEALGAKPIDDAAVAAVRGIDASTAERVASAVSDAAAGTPEQPHLVALVRQAADAAREAMLARRAAEGLRKLPAPKQVQALKDVAPVLGAKDALVKLHGLDAGALAPTAKVVALMLAADHLESARGLDPRAKVLAAAPAFEVVFGVPRPTGEPKPGDWLAYVSSAAAAAGHPADAKGTTHEREQAAFAGVVEGFADRLEAAGKQLEPGEAKEATAGYAKRLRVELAEAAQRAKAKAEAKATTDAAVDQEQKKAAPKKKK